MLVVCLNGTEGYHDRVLSDLVLADPLTPEELADRIVAELGVVG